MLFTAFLRFTVLATATSIDSIEDYARLLDKRDVGVPADVFNNINFYVQHAAAAYCNYKASPGSPLKCDKNACPQVEQNKAYVVGSYVGSTTGLSCYVSLDLVRKEIVLSLRGSDSLRNFVTDMLFFWHDCHFTNNCKVHAGFSKGWREIRDEAVAAVKKARGSYPDFRLIAVGHSLGGAGAVLAAADLIQDGIPLDIYTYGCPRVGNDYFSNWITGQPGAHFRVTHSGDPITRLPPLTFGYRHMSPEYWITNGGKEANDPNIVIKTCPGIKNTDCSGGTSGMNFNPHLHYLGDTSACLGNPLKWKRSDPLNAEMEQRLNEWSRNDVDFAQNNK
ncbi:hypothetical protein E4U42_003829 [Claviceps africana]|uniref:Triacylglycerol lipase n=1 Tax=Claviceps africana TaxID=83212 RepID=A0A8K0J778_9HYPO|nr:hypothetical protein E4U42_003829 [Claviceps africana]